MRLRLRSPSPLARARRGCPLSTVYNRFAWRRLPRLEDPPSMIPARATSNVQAFSAAVSIPRAGVTSPTTPPAVTTRRVARTRRVIRTVIPTHRLWGEVERPPAIGRCLLVASTTAFVLNAARCGQRPRIRRPSGTSPHPSLPAAVQVAQRPGFAGPPRPALRKFAPAISCHAALYAFLAMPHIDPATN